MSKAEDKSKTLWDTLPDYEVRYWDDVVQEEERPLTYGRWRAIGYAHTREFAAILGNSLAVANNWHVQVWILRNNIHPVTQTELPSPSIVDIFR